MFEVYGFLAMFMAQIVILTILHPAQLIARIRAQLARYPAEKFPQLYPEGRQWLERRLRFYRRLNVVIGIVGLALLGWFFNYMHQPDWSDGPVETLGAVFFMLQLSPILLFMWTAARRNQRLRHAIREQARKVVFERRGLFDFVSPVVVFATLLCYPLFIAFCVYLERNPFPGYAGLYVNVAIVTALYAATAVAVYAALYGKKANPLQSHADRMRTIELMVKVCIYSCLAAVAFLSLNFTLVLFDLQRWEPLGHSAYLVLFALLYLKGLNAGMIGPPSELEIHRLRSTPVC